MDKYIINFINENKIASICCNDEKNNPHCFHCFYAFDEKNYLLFFKSSISTLHSVLLSEGSIIAGSILPEKINYLALRGIQLRGRIICDISALKMDPDTFYHTKNPIALAKAGKVWCIELLKVKMSDNTRFFGSKLNWERNPV
jgi:uncharacterized protein YhbP (UPF0306 family)